MPRALLVMIVIGALTAELRADPGRTIPAFEKAAAMREARAHFEIGLRHYNLGEFDRAIIEFKLAYRRSEEPGLLFNLAQAHRAKGDARNALHFYAAYLRMEPKAPERAYVESRMRELEKQLRPPEPSAPRPATPVVAPPPAHVIEAAAALTAEPHARESGKAMKIAGIAAATAGAAALVAGGYYSIQADQASDEVSAVFEKNGRWTRRHDELVAEGERAELAAAVLYVVGGAAVVTGGVLYWFGVRREDSAPRLAVSPVTGGLRVGMRWGF